MEELTILLGAYVLERPGQEREIVLIKPGLAPAWRADLPSLLDQRPGSTALVDYVVKLYRRQMPAEAELTGGEALAEAVRGALARASGEEEQVWDLGWSSENGQ